METTLIEDLQTALSAISSVKLRFQQRYGPCDPDEMKAVFIITRDIIRTAEWVLVESKSVPKTR